MSTKHRLIIIVKHLDMTDTLTLKAGWVPRINSHYRLQWEAAQSAYVLLYPEGMIRLNDSGGEILSLCSGDITIEDLIDELKRKFPDAESLEQDVLEFLSVAFERNWLTHD
jgi:pyrroloquinoline quinone biosynthesis protein D